MFVSRIIRFYWNSDVTLNKIPSGTLITTTWSSLIDNWILYSYRYFYWLLLTFMSLLDWNMFPVSNFLLALMTWIIKLILNVAERAETMRHWNDRKLKMCFYGVNCEHGDWNRRLKFLWLSILNEMITIIMRMFFSWLAKTLFVIWTKIRGYIT